MVVDSWYYYVGTYRRTWSDKAATSALTPNPSINQSKSEYYLSSFLQSLDQNQIGPSQPATRIGFCGEPEEGLATLTNGSRPRVHAEVGGTEWFELLKVTTGHPGGTCDYWWTAVALPPKWWGN
ncbi:unnamed protein product [Ilex paraguariensis]|uniref:Uncharacterized protein n=1 Tax=Ilex paraguariensis TaxID=185542 RepID=A0ABC8V1P7_9AQUA